MNSAPRRPGILARPEDLHCIVFHGVCLLSYAAAFTIWRNAGALGIDTIPEYAAFVASAGYLLGWISGVDVGVNFHNHTHRRIFTRPWLNRWYGRFWTFSGGWPSFYWEWAHVRVHHAHVLETRDWTLPHQRADGTFESLYRYALVHWPWRYARHLWRDFAPSRAGWRTTRRALQELLIFAMLWSIPFWIDAHMALWLWLLPHWVGNAVTMASGMYVQHAGCAQRSREQPVRHSNSFRSRFFNLTMFNIGYHVEHHDHPGVHWADLPGFHALHEEELRAAGARYVPFGYYGAATRVASAIDAATGLARFEAGIEPRPPAEQQPLRGTG